MPPLLEHKAEVLCHHQHPPLNAFLTRKRDGGTYHQPPSLFLSRSNVRWRHLPPPSLSMPPSLERETEVLCHHYHHLPLIASLIASLARTRDGGTYHQPPSQYLPRSNTRRRHFPTSLSLPPSLKHETEVLCHHHHPPLQCLPPSNRRWRDFPPPPSHCLLLECKTEVLCHHHHHPPSQYLPHSNARWRHFPPSPSHCLPCSNVDVLDGTLEGETNKT